VEGKNIWKSDNHGYDWANVYTQSSVGGWAVVACSDDGVKCVGENDLTFFEKWEGKRIYIGYVVKKKNTHLLFLLATLFC
jgi:hypothetical protein